MKDKSNEATTRTDHLPTSRIFSILTFQLVDLSLCSSFNRPPQQHARRQFREVSDNDNATNDVGIMAAISPETSGVPILHQENAYTRADKTTFKPVVYVALINIAINTLRPDPNISWQARIPRVLYEIAIAIVASLASKQAATTSTSDIRSSITGNISTSIHNDG